MALVHGPAKRPVVSYFSPELQPTLQQIPRWKLALAILGMKISMGMETRPGWSGYLEFFIFWCRSCQTFTKDYAHSFPETRYLTCQHCDRNIRWPMRSVELRYAIALIKLAVRTRLTTSRTSPVTGG